MLNSRPNFIWKTDLDSEKKRITVLTTKNFLKLSVLNVYYARNKCWRLRDFIIDISIDTFCMSEIWIYDDDSTTLGALTPES